jgi:CheY-like chemotaxis protein
MKPKILLVDDNNIVNFISRKTIEDCAFADHITEFTSARRALKFLEKISREPGSIPELVFLDIKMQLMDGFEFLDHFRNLPEAVRNKTKIVMLTSSLLDNDRERAFAHENFIEFLNKPVTRDKLKAIQNKLLLT